MVILNKYFCNAVTLIPENQCYSVTTDFINYTMNTLNKYFCNAVTLAIIYSIYMSFWWSSRPKLMSTAFITLDRGDKRTKLRYYVITCKNLWKMDFIKPQLLPFIVFNIPPVPFLHTIKHYHCRGSFRFTVFRQSWSKYLCQNVIHV